MNAPIKRVAVLAPRRHLVAADLAHEAYRVGNQLAEIVAGFLALYPYHASDHVDPPASAALEAWYRVRDSLRDAT